MIERFDCREAFQRTLIDLAANDERIVAVVNDSVGSSKLGGFQKAYPDRLINVGIAEQNMVGVGAGLANGGRIPFVSGAAPFLTGRALEQIKADVAYSNANVKLCGQSPGMAYGELGPTHHSIEDLSWTRAIDNLNVLVPADPAQTRAAVRWAVENPGPLYLRVPRFKVPEVTPEDAPLEPGQAITLRDGDDVTIVAVGTMVSRAIDAAEKLRADGIQARVINMPFVDPLDQATLLEAARETRGIVTVEEAIVSGGLGAAVASLVSQHQPTPMRILGITGFAPTGSASYLLDHFGLTADGIAAAAHELA
jgi:transketolase